MVSHSLFTADNAQVVAPSRQREILHNLVMAASTRINAQLDAFGVRLASALHAGSEVASEGREWNLNFAAGKLLEKNQYPFFHLASAETRTALQDAVDLLDPVVQQATRASADTLTLVPFEVMDNRLLLDRAARPLEIQHAELLSALNLRLAALLGREQIGTADNPFRPGVLVAAMDRAWRAFDPEEQSHHLMMLQMSAGVFLDLAPILQAVNEALIAAGILPLLGDQYQIRKSAGNRNQGKEARNDPALVQQLRRLFNPTESAFDSAPLRDPAAQLFARHAGAVDPALSAYLADIQQRQPMSAQSTAAARTAYRLSELQQQMPRGAMSRADETTVDVMTRTFDAVFRDPHIPQEMKDLIGYLQIPVLKAALIDKEFFFEDAHPARRLISLLTTSSIGWDQSKGRDDPLYQAIHTNVSRAQAFDNEIALFSEVVANLEGFLKQEEGKSAVRLAAPITQALKQEKLREATRSASSDVAVRVATGEVAVFVEAFLESRWVPVLALAHSVKEEKPQVLASAIKTMDDLIWSVQPKITVQQRRELVAKLPALLTTLNKWLSVLKWDDAERLRFFADLAECHASIVRAPLELSPHRQLELAVEAARKAAERRLEKRAVDTPPAAPDPFVEQVESLERGTWFEFRQPDASLRRVKLAWVSPLKSLYIFTTVHREEAFSLGAEVLAQNFRDEIVRIVDADGFVDRALVDALADSGTGSQHTEEPVPA
jgi:hypothetical protein